MTASDPRHPLWSFLRTCLVLVVLLVLLCANAQQPDWTELRVWIGACVAALVAQGGHELLKARASKAD